MTHFVASITAHGFGHLAITAPVVERLLDEVEGSRLTVSSVIPERVLRSRIRRPFDIVADRHDFGLRMRADLSVDTEATVADYASLHRAWDAKVDERAEWLAGLHCELLLSNISYLNIAAAGRAGIPAVALSPLNWADLYRYFAPDSAATRTVFEQMVDAYRQSRVFLAPEPCMPMPHFDNLEVIPPVTQLGRPRRDVLNRLYGLDESASLVLLALGGLEAGINLAGLPVIEGVRWLVEDRWGLRRHDILSLDRAGLIFPDLLASCDLLVAKPGYGAFAEAACLGKPVVYLRRPGWPEEEYLIDWAQRQMPCLEAPRDDAGAVRTAVLSLLGKTVTPACTAAGVDVGVKRVRRILDESAAAPVPRCRELPDHG